MGKGSRWHALHQSPDGARCRTRARTGHVVAVAWSRLAFSALLSCVVALSACSEGTGGVASTAESNQPFVSGLLVSVSEAEGLILTVSARAGGSVRAAVAGAAEVTVGAGRSRDFAFGTESTATLTAVPATGWAFAGWTMSGDRVPACAADSAEGTCRLEAGSVTADARAAAAFAAAAATLTVSAGAGGSVRAAVAGAAEVTVGAGLSWDFAFGAESTATLVAVPAAGYTFAGWAPPGGRSCAAGTAGETCGLPASSVTADTTLGAAFAAATATLTVSAGAGGSVSVVVGFGSAQTVSAGDGFSINFVSGTDVRLLAVPDDGYAFSGWRLSDGLSCASATTEDPACMLAVADLDALADPATADAAFEIMATTLTVSAGANGRVAVAVRGVAAEAVEAGESQEYPFDVESTATLVAEPDPGSGYAFAGWALSPDGLSCVGGTTEALTCVLADGTAVPVAATATFTAAQATLTVSVSGPEGAGASVAVVFGGGSPTGAASHGVDFSAPTVVTALAGVMLTATAAAGYAFSGWRLSDGLSCASATTEDPACMLAVADLDALADPAMVEAAFELMATTLTVTAGAGGSVRAAVAGAAELTVGAGRSRDFAFGAESTATLVAVPAAGYTFAGWALPGGRSCSGGPAGETCGLPAGSVTADATLGAAFAAAAATLTVTAGAGGSVRAAVAGAAELTVGAGRSRDFAFGAESTATLVAVPAAGYTFAGWALPGGRSCSGGPAGETCGLPAGSVTADATLGAAFAAAAATLTVTAGAGGSVRAAVAGAAEVTVGAGRSRDFAFGAESTATLVAVPAAGYTFAGWALPGGRSCSGGPARRDLRPAGRLGHRRRDARGCLRGRRRDADGHRRTPDARCGPPSPAPPS